MIKYEYIKGTTNKLLVIFQDMNYVLDDIAKVDDDDFYLTNEKVHNKLKYYKLSQKIFKDYNILFLKDDFSGICGWYYFDYDKTIVKEINNLINEFYKKTSSTELYFFGSSKGGFASILYGLENENCTLSYALCPQLNISYALNYSNHRFHEKIKEKINYTNRVEEIKSILKVRMNKKNDSKIFIISSKNDEYFKDYKDEIISSKIKDNIEFVKGKNHSEMVYTYGEYALRRMHDKIEGEGVSRYCTLRIKFRNFASKMYLLKNKMKRSRKNLMRKLRIF